MGQWVLSVGVSQSPESDGDLMKSPRMTCSRCDFSSADVSDPVIRISMQAALSFKFIIKPQLV